MLIEFQPLRGHAVRVSAIDPITNTEVSLIGDLRYGRPHLKRLAVRKLEYVLAKKRRGGAGGNGSILA